jgi:uncharacterized membrane protein
MGHHTILKPVRRANVATLFLNGAILLLVALFPFPTRTVGRFIGTQAEATAVAFYAGFTGLIGLSMLLLTLYLRSHQSLLMAGDPGIVVLQRLPRWQLTGVIAYAGLAALTLLSPRTALVGTFVMWVFWAVVLLRSEAHATLE